MLTPESFHQLKTSNSRFFYVPLEAPGVEWQGAVAHIQQLLERTRGMARANGDYFLYFFSPSEDEHFFGEEVWAGLEVVGPQLNLEDEGVRGMDLDSSECWALPFKLTSFYELFSLESNAREVLGAAQRLAPTWRIRLTTQTPAGSISPESAHLSEIHFFRET